jgi:mono/diheme cytochrome c family protein
MTRFANLAICFTLDCMRYAVVLFAVWVALAHQVAGRQHDEATHRHLEAAKVQNAVPSTPKSIADGASVYNRGCASCHGKTGAGDGPAAKQLNPKPSNLTDAEWVHGSSDGEIFAVVRSGIPKTAMKGFASKMTEHEIWDIINYLRNIGPKQ